jgi:hypothetical protein
MMLRAGVIPSLLVLALCSGAAAAAQPTISMEPEAVVASGITPGGQVSNGTLREGFQFINGQLVYVRLTVK